ncbi:hypothetical protein ZWY2020_025555 [Hordeum vulgare]|nr:hypothetical protein ZWY2020_025555 [Hordeum vulgare]
MVVCRAVVHNLDPGPSLDLSLGASVDDESSTFSALEGVPLGWLAKIAGDSTIVFCGEKGPAIEKLSAIQAKEILDGCLLAARERVVAEAENPTTHGLWRVGKLAIWFEHALVLAR